MNHERQRNEPLPTAEQLFHQAGELAVLTGDIEEINTDYEQFRQFVVQDFSPRVKQEWPTLRKLTYTPSYSLEGQPTGDMVWITLSDNLVRQDFIIDQHPNDGYTIEVDQSSANEDALPEISHDQMTATQSAIDVAFNGAAIDDDATAEQVDKIDFLLTHDRTPTPADILMLNEIITTLSAHNRKAR